MVEILIVQKLLEKKLLRTSLQILSASKNCNLIIAVVLKVVHQLQSGLNVLNIDVEYVLFSNVLF